MFRGTVKTQQRGIATWPVPIAAGGIAPEASSVGLEWGAVTARFIHAAAADEETKRSTIVVGDEEAILAVQVRCDVDRTALVRSFLDVAVGADCAACGEQSPRAALGFAESAVVVGSFSAVAGADLATIGGGAHGDHVQHAADGS